MSIIAYNFVDVVTAYKGLLKEKEALEASLAVLSNPTSDNESTTNASMTSVAPNEASSSANVDGDSSGEMQMQIATVMQSLATLSAEKSKMEASFQADKRTLRLDIQQKDKLIAELQDKVRYASSQGKLEVEKAKSKLIVERHEWEKESNNQMLMVRELQKLLSDERHLKENLEMQLNDLKMQFAQTDSESRVKELVSELEQTRRKLKEMQNARVRDSGPSAATENVMKQLQSEMMHLKKQHAAAIHMEQQRAQRAEERSKKLAAMHEERVANLENRLAELSTTVGTYDRLRQMDQENIQKLKEKIAQLSTSNDMDHAHAANATSATGHSTASNYDNWNLNELINEILQLKNILLLENSKLENPMDISKIYGVIGGSNQNGNEHADCMERYELLLSEGQDNAKENERLRESVEVLKTHIKTLQSKVEVLNRNIDEQELELRNKSQEYKDNLRQERTKWKEMASSTEMEYRAKLSDIELQLQKQRERSLNLLEEKENEIKNLKSSFDVFGVSRSIKQSISHQASDAGDDLDDDRSRRVKKVSASSFIGSISEGSFEGDDGNNASQTCKDSMHMLHYVHELSRKEVEISGLRKAKHLAESTLRQALQDKATAQEALYDKISFLEEQVDRLERCKSREGANLEYLKNVVLSFLASNDLDGKKHMVNAIGAVLKFSPSEMKTINNYFSKKI